MPKLQALFKTVVVKKAVTCREEADVGVGRRNLPDLYKEIDIQF